MTTVINGYRPTLNHSGVPAIKDDLSIAFRTQSLDGRYRRALNASIFLSLLGLIFFSSALHDDPLLPEAPDPVTEKKLGFQALQYLKPGTGGEVKRLCKRQ